MSTVCEAHIPTWSVCVIMQVKPNKPRTKQVFPCESPILASLHSPYPSLSHTPLSVW